ncbi:hypothetical protein M5X17_30040 [Paenibacillus alvei]|uniref:hypothetical protein n=1 Tax=Paenibacillus alvei TaxID=44250 RepID=UPI0022831D86|nr:hypothetical protein [Paenibacillus alvei]MCY7485722.1 hypothetical protein [Paenibacillus alvei]MCY9737944.1 hypothetical protein [Paenibacillus alvei]
MSTNEKKKESYLNHKAEEYLNKCCKRRGELYMTGEIIHTEALHLDETLAEAFLDYEELVIDAAVDIKEAFKAGYKLRQSNEEENK